MLAAVFVSLAMLIQPPAPAAPAAKPEPGLPLGGFKLRALGPALMSGRVVGLAVHPTDKSTYYVAVASGGVWKTVNAGTTWTPLFDGENSYSVGCVVLDPRNPNTVWVGTGENNSQRSVGYGDGVYKSTDGGRSWANVGLKTSEHIGRIVIDPRDSDTVYVAAQGPLWGPGGERGLYKTTDGGKTWKAVLTVDENTGVTDVVLDPRNPDHLLAATYQRRRHVWTLVNGGPGSAVHRSGDGGKTWAKVTGGLPGGELGRIGLAVAPTDPDVVYAVVEAADKAGGLFRSADRGVTWEKRNPFDAQAQYYAHVVVDPANKDRVYVMNVHIQVSDDGGRTLAPLPGQFKHVDNHTIWIDPADPKHLIVGCDGGVYTSHDRAATWVFAANLPVTQFYDAAVDQNPKSGPFYHVYGGTQDNNTLGGPVRTRSGHWATNADWHVVQGGDGFHCAVDPSDPDIIYGEAQYGVLCRFDRRTGNRVEIQPLAAPGEPPLRWNWDSPLLISPHASNRLYFAANRLFKSDDRGDSWTPVSPDLTQQLDRDALPVFGKVQKPDAVAKHVSTSFYGNVVALAESPKAEGVLYAGTDDGLIQTTADGGKSWAKRDTFPGVPARTYVSKLVAGRHAAGTVYAAFDNHKNADFKPYLLKSQDGGASWTSIAGNLPERGTVYCLAEDHVDPDLLFCGTEFGLYVTSDGGKAWQRMKGGLPTIQVKDLVIQRANNDLVVATFGRGFYVFDDYSPLRTLTPAVLVRPGAVAASAETMLYVPSYQYGGVGKAFQGAALYTADPAPFGCALTVHVKDAPKSKKQLRQDAEKAADKAKQPAPYPTPEALRAEAEEEAPAVVLVITDTDQAVRRTLAVPAGAGVHRVMWDLHESGLSTTTDLAGGGPRVTPGTYFASLHLKQGGRLTRLAEPATITVVPDPLSGLAAADYQAIAAFNAQTRKLRIGLAATTTTAAELATRLDQVKTALDLAPKADEAARVKVRELIEVVRVSRRALTGDAVLAGRNENVPASIADRARYAATATDAALARPTGTQKQAAADAARLLAAEVAKLRPVAEVDVPALEKTLEALGAPLPAGRLPGRP